MFLSDHNIVVVVVIVVVVIVVPHKMCCSEFGRMLWVFNGHNHYVPYICARRTHTHTISRYLWSFLTSMTAKTSKNRKYQECNRCLVMRVLCIGEQADAVEKSCLKIEQMNERERKRERARPMHTDMLLQQKATHKIRNTQRLKWKTFKLAFKPKCIWNQMNLNLSEMEASRSFGVCVYIYSLSIRSDVLFIL